MACDISKGPPCSSEIGRSNGTRQMSQGFAEQIRQLELEGSKLLEATYTLSSSVITASDVPKDNHAADSAREMNRSSHKTTDPSLSALTDITADQKTIDDLRVHLDAQSRETERLQRSLAEPPSRGGATFMSANGSLRERSSSLSSLNLPLTSGYTGQDLLMSGHSVTQSGQSFGLSLSSGYPPSQTSLAEAQLERQVKEMKEEITSLRHRLRQALSLGEEQKQSFRMAQEELKRQLTAAITAKDNIIDAKTREVASQEGLMARLQSTVQRVERDKNLQEKTLLEMNERYETAQKGQYVVENMTSQLRKMVAERERRRGRPFSDTENVGTQSLASLLHHVERHNTEVETENEQNRLHLRQVLAELESLKSSNLERQHTSSRHHQDRLTEMAENHNKELILSVERSMQARSEVATLQEQLSVTRQENNQKLADKDDIILQLRRELDTVNQTNSHDRAEWLQKKQALETALEASRAEVDSLKKDHDDAIYRRAKLEGKIEDLQRMVEEMEGAVQRQRAADETLSRERSTVEQDLTASTRRLEESQQEVVRLSSLVHVAQVESSAQLQTAVATLEREQNGRAAEQLQTVTEQLVCTTARVHELTLQHEVLKADHKNLLQRHVDMEAALLDTTKKFETEQSSRETLTMTVQEQLAELGRLSQDREDYLKLAEKRGKDLRQLRVETEKVGIQLDERQSNMSLLREQNEQMKQLMHENVESTCALRKERDELANQLGLHLAGTEQSKTTTSHLAKKLRIREKHLSDLQEDNQQMAVLLLSNKEDLEQLAREKDRLYTELKDSRYEVSELRDTNNQLENNLANIEGCLHKDLSKLTEKLRGTETELKIVKKTMKTKEHVDGKAVRVAGQMQREVTEKRSQIDSLQSKARWLEECLEKIAKEKKAQRCENERLSASLQKLLCHNERLTTDLGGINSRERDMQTRINKLETALEKAAVKHSTAQVQIEQFEQDNARLKLKHQLEMKELLRAFKTHPKHHQSGSVKAVPVKTVTTPQKTKPTTPPTALANHQQTVEDRQLSGGVGAELQELLQEMRSLIQAGKQTQPAQQPPQQPPLQPPQQPFQHPPDTFFPPSTAFRPIAPACTMCYGAALNRMSGDGVSNHRFTGTHAEELHAIDLHPTKLISSGKGSSIGPWFFQPKVQYAAPVPTPAGAPAPALAPTPTPELLEGSDRYLAAPSPGASPVSDLLADTFTCQSGQATVSSISAITDDFEDSTPLFNSKIPQLPTDTNIMCKRLEKKLQKLSKLGCHLVDENREISEMMRNQDFQLKKVRHNGKLLKP